MSKLHLFRIIAVIMAFAMIMAMAGCSAEPAAKDTEPSQLPDSRYTVKITNRAGNALSKCSVEIFSDKTMSERIFKGITNKDGEVIFTAPVSGDYVAVLSKVPAYYHIEPQYDVAGGTTTIVLEPGVMDEAVMENMTFSLGNPMMDFTVTLPDNSEVTLSDLLKEKKAVILNFWFMKCGPCIGEFPHLQEGFEQVSEDIALLALNPVDGTAAELAKFQADNGYTFTMSKCDPRWERMLKITGYPTTVVIDRFGDICLIHTGDLKSTDEFLTIANYFISDDYEQKFFKSIGQIAMAE